MEISIYVDLKSPIPQGKVGSHHFAKIFKSITVIIVFLNSCLSGMKLIIKKMKGLSNIKNLLKDQDKSGEKGKTDRVIELGRTDISTTMKIER